MYLLQRHHDKINYILLVILNIKIWSKRLILINKVFLWTDSWIGQKDRESYTQSLNLNQNSLTDWIIEEKKNTNSSKQMILMEKIKNVWMTVLNAILIHEKH